jgi:hypothetical protein
MGLSEAAKDVEAAVAHDIAHRPTTPRSTAEVGDAILALLNK